ncbi:NAD(P) transhydrogenase subunit alpha [Glaciihabitans sp. UYNi722]|uniref:NAD(P) transhydrogenase subunit alpha n=1 Tax=Glaciihabitans sp. UYNi722 TaxID=3156344 RepID=UPI0033974E27
MSGVTVGVLTETAADERRVALDPSAVVRLVAAGRTVLVQSGAGKEASFADADYEASGATISTRRAVLTTSNVIAVVRALDEALIDDFHTNQLVIGLLEPLTHLASMQKLADRGITAVAFELLPRTLSRAQSMDALSSQSSAAGYRAAIVAAATFGRYLPMMITASGTATPAKVIVIGAGVAGLQAIATAKRLGAVVTGYDVRESSRGEVESLGATFLTPLVTTGSGAGGYARAMSVEEQRVQRAELAAALRSFDIIITTAKVPGKTPPMLVSKETLATLRSGSVCIDLGSSDRGGNIAGSVEGHTTTTSNGVTIVGAGELASDLPASASQMYGRNVVAAIASLIPQDRVTIDPSDDVHRGIVVCHDGELTNAVVRSAVGLRSLEASVVGLEVAAS